MASPNFIFCLCNLKDRYFPPEIEEPRGRALLVELDDRQSPGPHAEKRGMNDWQRLGYTPSLGLEDEIL